MTIVIITMIMPVMIMIMMIAAAAAVAAPRSEMAGKPEIFWEQMSLGTAIISWKQIFEIFYEYYLYKAKIENTNLWIMVVQYNCRR